MKNKKTILIDLDGVLNNYTGDFDKSYIPEIKEGAHDFLKSLHRDYNIKLFTTRDKTQAKLWLKDNNLENYITDVKTNKDLVYLFIDDRCINFKGNYEELYTEIKNFKPWYKQH